MKTKLFAICLLLFTSQVFSEEITFKLAYDASVRATPCSTSSKFKLKKGSVLQIAKIADVHGGMILTRWFKVKTKYKAIIIAKPMERFSEKDKFIIDQYVMYGGRVVWLVDPVFASMDSLLKSNVTMAIPMDLNLEVRLLS